MNNSIGNNTKIAKVLTSEEDPLVTKHVNSTVSPLEFFLSRKIATTTFAVAPTVDSYVVELTDATGAIANLTHLEVWGTVFGSVRLWSQVEIEDVDENTVTLAMTIGAPFTTDAVVRIVDINLASQETASLETPFIYSFDPPPNTEVQTFSDFEETRFIIHMVHDSAGQDILFGDLEALTNGVVFRGRGSLGATTIYNNLFNAKNNGNWVVRSYDLRYRDTVGGTKRSTSVRKTFNGRDKSDVVIPVRQEFNEATEAVIRDDLTDLVSFNILVMGRTR